MKKLNLNAIRIDGGTQVRVSLSEATVAEYTECLDQLPPVVVFFDGSDNWLADGFHRLHAYRNAGKASIPADIRTGTRREAVLYSFGANGGHGLRMTNSDKRNAVAAMLADAEWSKWSDRKIAEACWVTHPFVAGMRKPPEVVTVTTRVPKKEAEKVVTVTTPKTPKRQIQERPADIPEAGADELAEAQHTITDLAQENETLRDRLAVEAMDASEDEKTQASQTISELRERVRLLGIEVDSLKKSRDTYMRESNELKRQCLWQQKQLKKALEAA